MTASSENRFSLDKILNSFITECQKIPFCPDDDWCILAIDVENFKLFNQVYGREVGNILLMSVDKILQDMKSSRTCVTSYMGRDDFAVFMEYDTEAIDNLYSRLTDAVSQLVPSLGFRPAIGIAHLSDDADALLDAFDQAVIAASDAKKSQTERIVEHNPKSFQREKDEYDVLLRLKKAVDDGRVTFYLQPQCRISSGRIVGAEALARWIDTDGSVISPGAFIPTLERKGFIADFDLILWEMIFRWIRSLLDRSLLPVPISLNVSQLDIVTVNVCDVLCSLCEKYNVPNHLIKVEITESSYAQEGDKVQQLVNDLRSHGFITMMDDFGSGYSSLNMLENVNVDVIKLDMMFVKERNINSRKGITIIESIINMAKMMGLPIVVEGVETDEQAKFLKNLGCRYAQGYHFHKPMPIEEFEKMLLISGNLDYRGFQCKMNEQIHVREFLDENTFTDTMLNNVLGAVAFYSLDGRDLTITRFNEQFYAAIGDSSMDKRQQAIQNYVVKEDWPSLYKALDDACEHIANGGICEIRFYKSDGSVFWFRMHFFYLKNDQQRKIFYGQVEDVTEVRQQSIQFFEVLREKAEATMMLNLDQQTIQYFTGTNTLYQVGLPSIDLESSLKRTCNSRIDVEDDRRKFLEFFNIDRLRAAYLKAIYHETMTIGFRMRDKVGPVEFSTYYIRHSKDQDLIVYIFAVAK